MSSPLLMKVTSYFTPPQHYFWRWADKGNVIEWKSGVSTICYREELVEILLQMADKEGMPPLGAVLLVLAACKGDHSKVNIWSGILFELFGKAIADKDVTYADTLKQNTFRALQLMESIIALPAEYRTGDKRHWLMHTIFAQAEKISPAMSFAMLHEFRSGKLDNYIFKDGFESFVETFYSDMQCLGGAGRTFETTGSLELRLRTGLSSIPVAVPEIETPQEKPADLLDQLSQDEKTSGLASLTRRLVAALNIPMHAYGQSDQSFGGVSDISNRGNFDRLLLSELAHDDLSLMARLANNEALYL